MTSEIKWSNMTFRRDMQTLYEMHSTKKNCWISLGSFSIDDGDGSENVTLNMNQRFFNFVAFIPVRWKRLM